MDGKLVAWIGGIGLLAPGLPDWATAVPVLNGGQSYLPAPSVLPVPDLLPPAERRRASRVVRLALAVGLEAVARGGVDAATLATVFSASGADGHNCHALCETLASSDRQVSPTRFHNSVHNAAAGYWGIATGAMAPCQVLCAYDASFSAGLLEALVQVNTFGLPVLLVAYDAEYPEPLRSLRPIPDAAGIALLLMPHPAEACVARLEAGFAELAPTKSGSSELEALRLANPALRGLPLLERLAKDGSGQVALEYLEPLAMVLEVAPC